MTDAAEEFDRTRVLRRVTFHREIPTASLEGYWQQWDAPEIRNDPSTAPAVMADEYAALVSGEAVERLRWRRLRLLLAGDVPHRSAPHGDLGQVPGNARGREAGDEAALGVRGRFPHPLSGGQEIVANGGGLTLLTK